jgi:Lrp/AsnC family leucine-responsive transcriptional regulator
MPRQVPVGRKIDAAGPDSASTEMRAEFPARRDPEGATVARVKAQPGGTPVGAPAPARRPLADPIDRQIAAALVADGRSTLKALATITGLSVSAVQARVRRLEADGVIRGYTALLDAEAIGLPLAALISITPLDPAQPDDSPEALAGLPEIEACHSVAGDASYILFVRVATPTALEQLIREIRRRANVSTRTTVVLQTFFERRAEPPVL